MRPKDFWALSPWEFWQIAEAKRPRQTYAGGLTEEEAAEIHDWLVEMGARNG